MGWFSTPTPTDHHNQGQKDASEGKPSMPPDSGPVATVQVFLGSIAGGDQVKADGDAYRQGYNNTSGQKSGK